MNMRISFIFTAVVVVISWTHAYPTGGETPETEISSSGTEALTCCLDTEFMSWINPCGHVIHKSVTSQRHYSLTRQSCDNIRLATIKTREARGLAHALKALIGRRISDPVVVDFYENYEGTLFHYANMTAFNEINSVVISTIEESLARIYNVIMTAIIYLEQTRYQSIHDDLDADVLTLVTVLRNLQCNLEFVLVYSDLSVPASRTCDVLNGPMLITFNRTDRYLRDYVVVRDVQKAMKTLVEVTDFVLYQSCRE